MTRSLLSVFLLIQGSEAMRELTKPLKEPPKASLKDPEAAMRPRRLQAGSPYVFQDNTELFSAVQSWLGDRPSAMSMYGHISTWDVSAVTDMDSMFWPGVHVLDSAEAFNDDISKWITSSVTTMSWVFADASAFNQDIGAWDTARVEYMDSMFKGASAFNQYIGAWDTARVEWMDSMFRGASAFNQDISEWIMASVTGMSGMFWHARAFDQDLGWYVTPSDEALLGGSGYFADDTPCASDNCGVTFVREGDGNSDSGKARRSVASESVIIVVCVAAAAILLAALFVWNKRAVAHKQPHRESSMPTVGGKGDVEVAESADQ